MLILNKHQTHKSEKSRFFLSKKEKNEQRTWPSAGPKGGDGAAFPAPMYIFSVPDNFLAAISVNTHLLRSKVSTESFYT